MSQLNIHVTASFEEDLNKFMKLRHVTTKSEAIRLAIREGVQHASAQVKPENFTHWLGLAIQVPTNKKARFSSDDDLWG